MILEFIIAVEGHLNPWGSDCPCRLVLLLLSQILQVLMRKLELSPVGELTGTLKKKAPYYVLPLMYATEHRCGVVVKGPNLSGNISETEPLKDNHLLLKAKALDESHEAKNTANVVNELSKEITKNLVSHPVNAQRAAEGKNIANVVLLRGCGIRIEVMPFIDKHDLGPCMVAKLK